MAQITLKGNPINTCGNLPAVNSTAPDFVLVTQDLKRVDLSDYAGKRKVLSIFPSVDTGVCATSVRTFNQKAGSLKNTVVLNISADLPFAFKRFCGAEGIDQVETLSTLGSSFGRDYGLEITTGPLAGLCSRAVIVLDENNKVLYTEQVPEITQEPDYAHALAVLG
jgi:thiol peroxidase